MTAKTTEPTRLFLEFSRHQLLQEFWTRMRENVASLTEEELWWRPNPACNSIANLMLHLNGNVRQWLISSFTHEPFPRNRPAEFSATEGAVSRTELLTLLDATMRDSDAVLVRLTDADLTTTYAIQENSVTGLEAIYHVVEHFAMHYGQILYLIKSQHGREPGFYRELNASGQIPAGEAK
jgi:uncharacterized damage-inducible protein DinB